MSVCYQAFVYLSVSRITQKKLLTNFDAYDMMWCVTSKN